MYIRSNFVVAALMVASLATVASGCQPSGEVTREDLAEFRQDLAEADQEIEGLRAGLATLLETAVA